MREESAVRMNAKLLGSGKETLVLAHGYGGDQSVWDKVVPLLAARHRVLVFEWCFSGDVKDQSFYDPTRYSSYDAFADDLISLVRETEVAPCVLVGHSMSGMIGCIASVKRSDLFKRLVLVGATPRNNTLLMGRPKWKTRRFQWDGGSTTLHTINNFLNLRAEKKVD